MLVLWQCSVSLARKKLYKRRAFIKLSATRQFFTGAMTLARNSFAYKFYVAAGIQNYIITQNANFVSILFISLLHDIREEELFL